MVEILEPKEAEPCERRQQLAASWAGRERQHEVLNRPSQCRGGSRGGATFDFVEIAKQAPVTQICEPREVKSGSVDLLHERGFGIHQAAWFEHATGFRNYANGVDDVFEDGLQDYSVERLALERQIMPVANILGIRRRNDVRLGELKVGRRVLRIHAGSVSGSTDN